MNMSGLQSHGRSPGGERWTWSTCTWPKGWAWVCVTLPASEARPRSPAPPPTSSWRVKSTSKALINTGEYYSSCFLLSSLLSLFEGSSLGMEMWSTLPAGLALPFPTCCSCWCWPFSGFSLCSWASSKYSQPQMLLWAMKAWMCFSQTYDVK